MVLSFELQHLNLNYVIILSMAFSWRVRKQLSYLSVVILALVLIVGFFAWRQFSGGTCFDNKQNQKETGADCGGPCLPCPVGLKEPILLWVKFFPINDTVYDVAALIENLNYNWSSERIVYAFKLYDKDNVLIIERDGTTFLNGKETAFLFESGLRTGQRKPSRAVLEIEPVKIWKYTEKFSPQFIVAKKNFNPSSSLLEIEIKNDTSSSFADIYLFAALFDKENNAFAASATKIDRIAGIASQKANFTWQKKFDSEPSRIEIYARVKVIK